LLSFIIGSFRLAKRWPQLGIARARRRSREVDLELDEEVADVAHVRRLVAEVVALGAKLEVREQPDRDALRDRAELDALAFADQPRHPAVQGSLQRARRLGQVAARDRDLAALGRAVDRPGTLLPRTESRSRFSGQSICSIEASKTFMRAATDGLLSNGPTLLLSR
jgi:hypothetical protein